MKSSSVFAQAIIIVLLVGAGAILWRSSEHERRIAAAERDLVMLKYDDAAAAAIATPDAKLLAANATYRKIRAAGGSWQAVVGRMDSLVKQYAEIIRDNPNNTEAAFNYEYVVRLRTVIAQRKLPVPPNDQHANGLTVHGFPGAPPEEADMKKFKMIVPMRPDERLEAEKAGKGTTKVRKG